MSLIVAVANQKGGVGKTFLVFHLAFFALEKGYSVLVVDLDPQGNLSLCFRLGENVSAPPCLVAEVFEKERLAPLEVRENFYLVPSDIQLARYEAMASGVNVYFKLKRALGRFLNEFSVDFVFIDCPPSLGLFSLSAFVAARKILVPLRTEVFSVSGLGDLLNVVSEIQENINSQVEIAGLVLNAVSERTRVARETLKEIEEGVELPVLAVVPHSIKAEEALRLGRPVWEVSPASRIAQEIRKGLKTILSTLQEEETYASA